MELLIAIGLAVLFGLTQYGLLLLGVRSMARGQMNVLYFVAQFFCPLVGLGLCAWLAIDQLVVCATIICGILFVGAACYYIYVKKNQGKKE